MSPDRVKRCGFGQKRNNEFKKPLELGPSVGAELSSTLKTYAQGAVGFVLRSANADGDRAGHVPFLVGANVVAGLWGKNQLWCLWWGDLFNGVVTRGVEGVVANKTVLLFPQLGFWGFGSIGAPVLLPHGYG